LCSGVISEGAIEWDEGFGMSAPAIRS